MLKLFKNKIDELKLRMGVKADYRTLDYHLKYVELLYFKYLFSQKQFDVLIDIGANRGQTIEEFRGVGFTGPIFSYEPNPDDFRILEQKFSADKLVELNNLAVSQEESLELNIFRDSRFSSVFTASTDTIYKNETKLTKKVQVKCISLDAIFEGVERKYPGKGIFVKVDTQGYDLEVLKTGYRSLANPNFKYLKTELSQIPIYDAQPLMTELMDFIAAQNFTLVFATPVTYTANEPVVELNGLFEKLS